MDEKWLVSVTAGKIQCHGILEAKKLGLKILSIDEDPSAIGFELSDQFINISLSKTDKIIKIIRSFDLNIIGAICFCSEAGLRLCAIIRDKFNLPGEQIETYNKFLNKGHLRSILSENSFKLPENWKVISSKSKVKNYIKKSNLPLIIKPTESSGSRGVSKIDFKDLHNLDFIINKAFDNSKNNEVIIETYMEGYECTVETFTEKGITTVLAITEKLKVDNTDGLIANELRTFNKGADLYNKIGNIIIEAIKIMGFNYGPCHSEVIVTKNNKIGIVEIGARGGGFLVFNHLVPLISGVNIAKLTILQAMGINVQIKEVEKKHAILKFITPKNGKIKSISGFEKLKNIEGISGASFVKVGDSVKVSESDGDRLGYLLSSALHFENALKLVTFYEKIIKYEYDN